MVDGILACRSMVDRSVGDTVMANSGTLILAGNDVQNAFSCAFKLNLKPQEFNKLRKKSL